MTVRTPAAGPVTLGDSLNLLVFGVFVAGTLWVVYRAGHGTRTRSDYYAAGGGFSGIQNGVAMSGDSSPPPRSSGSPGPSPSTGTTASCTR
jgi:cation/acetate symporter